MSYFDEVSFRTAVIGYIKLVFPTLPVVKRYQNVAQPVDILSGASMLDFHINYVDKIGTDYMLFSDANGVVTWRGDREVSVEMEYFGANALSNLCKLRDLGETEYLQQYCVNLGFIEQRQDNDPTATTRLHGNTKYVESAVYQTIFETSITYTDNQGLIETVTVPPGTINPPV